ncbi:uncharacterized protein DFL_006321 [Arthrobotrys flagrans]|uniref:Ribosomal protein L32e n=1 Tax=Arthrobotrys flagrans TaxID=97331 RepID=A0A437A013_ARTFL|nr:hypothetical protein DFL_006321 [Arthrobotrys flagrans]
MITLKAHPPTSTADDSPTPLSMIPSTGMRRHRRTSLVHCRDSNIIQDDFRQARPNRQEAQEEVQPTPVGPLQAAMPKIGYGSNKKTRHLTPSGHKAFLVHNVNDVDLLLMHNHTFAAEISHAVSSRKRIDIIAKAKALGVKVTNPKGRVTTDV